MRQLPILIADILMLASMLACAQLADRMSQTLGQHFDDWH